MSKFDIWTNGEELVAEKVKSPKSSKVEYFVYLATLNASSKGNALKQAETRIQNNVIVIPKNITKNLELNE